MERHFDKEKWYVIKRLEERYYNYTIIKDETFTINDNKVRIIVVKCLSKNKNLEYFTFVNDTFKHCYQDAIQILGDICIEKPKKYDIENTDGLF